MFHNKEDMDIQDVKQKILNGEMTDEELVKLLSPKKASTTSKKSNSGFLSTVLKGFQEGYAEPHLWRIILQISLLFVIVLVIAFLSYNGKIDAMITSVLLSFVLGFLFGKMK